MSQAATYIRNGVHPRRIVEMYMGEPVPGTGGLTADWGKKPPEPVGGYIDTRPPPGGRPFREANIKLLNGQNLPVWIAYVARGPRVSLLYALKHPDRKPEVVEMDRRAATLLARSLPALPRKPTMVVTMPSGSWQAGHFAEEVAKAAKLPLQTDVFKKTGSIKGTHFSEKQKWARANIRLARRDVDFEGQSVVLADDNIGSGASLGAAAELLYARGAAYVIGVTTFRITGAKDPEAEDVSLGFAKKTAKAVEPAGLPAPGVGEEDDEQQDEAPRNTVHDRDESVIAFLVDNKADIPTMTFRELVEMCDTTDIEMRFALAQLGLAKFVKPG